MYDICQPRIQTFECESSRVRFLHLPTVNKLGYTLCQSDVYASNYRGSLIFVAVTGHPLLSIETLASRLHFARRHPLRDVSERLAVYDTAPWGLHLTQTRERERRLPEAEERR